MMQICPDCQERCPDTSNYCGMCRAKLPNAKPWLTDYKIFTKDPRYVRPEEMKVLLDASFKDPQFKERVLVKILDKAFKQVKSTAKCEQYFADEVLSVLAQEIVKRYKVQTK